MLLYFNIKKLSFIFVFRASVIITEKRPKASFFNQAHNKNKKFTVFILTYNVSTNVKKLTFKGMRENQSKWM